MLENVKVAQIKKFKKQSPFIFEFFFTPLLTHMGRERVFSEKKSIYFRILLLRGPSPPTKNVYEGLNALKCI